MSCQCKDLIQACLRVCPGERIGVEQIRNHPWINATQQDPLDQDDHGRDSVTIHVNMKSNEDNISGQPPRTYPITVPANRHNNSVSSSLGSF